MRPTRTLYLLLLLLFIQCFRANAQTGLCPPNLDFEAGDFTNWVCQAGIVNPDGSLSLNNTPPIPGRHTIITRATSGVDFYGRFPTISPNGSGYSVKLGSEFGGHEAESISYTYAVPSSLTSFSILFHAAIVIQDGGHQTFEKPYFRARITDMTTGLPHPCVDFAFVSNGGLPGFQVSPFSPPNAPVYYKSWTPFSINLNAYIGKNIKIEFITNDCIFTQHFGYGYVDINTVCNGAITGNFICPGDQSITLNAPFGFQDYRWFSDMTFSTVLSTTQSLNLTPPPAVGAVFPVEVTPFTGFGCKDTLYAQVDVGTKPPSNAGPDRLICKSSQVQLGGLPTVGFGYLWTPTGNGQVTNNIISNPLGWIPNNDPPTEFYLKTTDLLTGCYSNDTTIVSTYQVDTSMQLVGNTAYCTGDPNTGTLTLLGGSLATIQWYNGITPIPGATGMSYHPVGSGSYWAQLQEGGCTDSTRIENFTINITPVSVAGPDASICTNQPLQIGTAPNPAYTYSWTPTAPLSDPNIANPFATVLVSTPIEFIVHTVDPASGCNSYDTVYIAGKPIDTLMSVTGKVLYCTGDLNAGALTVANTSAAIQWYDGTTPIPGATGANFQPTASGVYWAELQQFGCTDSTRQVPFTVNVTPVSVAGPDASICTNQPLQIGTASNPAYTYSWTPVSMLNDPAISNPFATVLVNSAVEFIVHTVDPLTGCNSYDTTYITGRPIDTLLSLTGKDIYCEGDAAAGTLFASNTVPAIQWYDGNTLIPGATGNSFHPLVSGNYWAELQQTGCSDSTRQVPFTVHGLPTVLFTANKDTSCITSNAYTFTNGSSVSDGSTLSYLWKFSDGGRQTVTDANKSFLLPGTYIAKLVTTTSNGCADSTDYTVHVLPNGVPRFAWDSICTDRQINFYNLSDEKGSVQVKYNWNFGNGGPGSLLKDPLPVMYTTPGKTDVTLKLVALGCEQDTMTLVRSVQVNKQAEGVRYTTVTVPQGSSKFLHARNFGINYNWMPKEQLSNYSTQYTEFFATNNDIDYTVEITDVHTCVTTDTVLMQILRKPGYYLPSAFTPNGDGRNDIVRPYLVGMKSLKSFSVFNRWGNLVFFTNEAGKGWDGKFKGVEQNSGVYIWILEYITTDDKKVTEKGSLTLIR